MPSAANAGTPAAAAAATATKRVMVAAGQLAASMLVRVPSVTAVAAARAHLATARGWTGMLVDHTLSQEKQGQLDRRMETQEMKRLKGSSSSSSREGLEQVRGQTSLRSSSRGCLGEGDAVGCVQHVCL